MKFDQYHYEAEGVNLDFSFPDSPEGKQQKVKFLDLLEQAIDELKEELCIEEPHVN